MKKSIPNSVDPRATADREDRPEKGTYTPGDLPDGHFEKQVGDPGQFPFTRGIYPDMYRGKLWTMRQFSGFGTASETNQRLRFLLQQGQTGLSIAFDLPTLMGLDSDDPSAAGEVGKCGVAVDSLADMEVLLDGIPLDQVTTSMTINAPAAMLLAMYVALAEKQGFSLERIGGTLQNDILKEYIAQKEWIYPPEPSIGLVVDTIEYCTETLPRFHPVSISGYHIREAGSSAVQELAFTLRDGIEYVEACVERGLDVDRFAPRLSFFFNSHSRFFEEIAKFRAARRMWARVMRDRFGAREPRSWQCRFHTQTAGCSLTAQQPMNNVIRTALQALAAVLGGTNSLHTNALDEALALPSESAVRLALRTQQIIAYESQVTDTVDPTGGSYYVEALTDRLEEAAFDYIRKIDELGGMVKAIEQGYPQLEIQETAYRIQKGIDSKQQIIVGVNDFVSDDEEPVETLRVSEDTARRQIEALHRLRAGRHNLGVQRSLRSLREAARMKKNTMPDLIQAAREYATVGEMCDVLKEVYGTYVDPGF